MKAKLCPQCKFDLEKVKFDIGNDIKVESLHCKKCGFNITSNKELSKVYNVK